MGADAQKQPDAAADVAPLSVADMELKNPPEIIEGLKDYLDTHILGYTARRRRITTPCAAG